ncbi:hypothetical protein DFP73DRAFT_568506 [Morchella snyderi]|nr:hypothetical protein DFP73DRAFT_568506 [Morchella snyderi]
MMTMLGKEKVKKKSEKKGIQKMLEPEDKTKSRRFISLELKNADHKKNTHRKENYKKLKSKIGIKNIQTKQTLPLTHSQSAIHSHDSPPPLHHHLQVHIQIHLIVLPPPRIPIPVPRPGRRHSLHLPLYPPCTLLPAALPLRLHAAVAAPEAATTTTDGPHALRVAALAAVGRQPPKAVDEALVRGCHAAVVVVVVVVIVIVRVVDERGGAGAAVVVGRLLELELAGVVDA